MPLSGAGMRATLPSDVLGLPLAPRYHVVPGAVHVRLLPVLKIIGKLGGGWNWA